MSLCFSFCCLARVSLRNIFCIYFSSIDLHILCYMHFFPFSLLDIWFFLTTGSSEACGRYQTQTPLLASCSTLPKKVVLGIIFKFFLLWLFTWLFPKCQPFPPNHFPNSCQILKEMWEGTLNITVTHVIPEARHNQPSIPQAFSMEWHLVAWVTC